MEQNGSGRRSRHGLHEKAEVVGEGPINDSSNGFRFTRIFPDLTPFALKDSVARTLGAAMTSELKRSDSDIPAGYTYFGQFVDHDITRDGTVVEADDPNSDVIEATADKDLLQKRSPSLDLDSVYGKPTEGGGFSPLVDGVRFKFTQTSPAPGDGRSGDALPYDIGRGKRGGRSVVLIPDNRNDENLAVSQTHALWMRFHNHVANLLEETSNSTDSRILYLRTRELVIRHYQYIVLHDFVKRFTLADVFDKVILNGQSKYFSAVPGEVPCMPLEFSVAAYRFGHSLVRDSYEWNRNFSTDGRFGAATFGKASKTTPNLSLFTFTNGGILGSEQSLPSNWIVDWRNLYDFSSTSVETGGVSPQMAKSIDPYLSIGMGNIPSPIPNLATANLRRSGLRGLPCGQAVSKEMSTVKVMSKSEIVKGLDSKLKEEIQKHGFDEKTPLWLYVLQEANARAGGNTLGEMGSTIVCETFAALINASEPSILASNWTTADSPVRLSDGGQVNSMPALIAWIEEREPILNPLG